MRDIRASRRRCCCPACRAVVPNRSCAPILFFVQAGEDVTKEFYGEQHPDTVPTTLEQFVVGVLDADAM
jgi:hypothetical protein